MIATQCGSCAGQTGIVNKRSGELQVTAMDESLEAFLTRLNLSQYFDNFREAGFDDLETAVTLSEEELEQSVGIVLPGHKRKLSLNFEKLRQPTTSSQSSQSSQAQLGKPRKLLRAKLKFQSGKLTAEFPEEPSDPEVPWKRFLIPQPRFPRQHFFNSILPQVYESAQPHLLAQFESYWIKERRNRWERKELLDTLTASVTRITDLSEKNYIVRVRSLPVPSRPQDVSTCVSAKKEVEQRIKQAEEIEAKLQQQKEELFESSSTRLKSWAKEQFTYIQETISTTIGLKSQLEAVREDIQQTHEELAKRHKFSLASAESRRKRKHARDNSEKAKRKIKAQKEIRQDILGKLCGSKEVMMEVAKVNDGGDIKLKRALEIGEASLPFLTTLQPRSHYNALLFLHKNGFFAQSLKVRVEEQLKSMEAKIKNFKGYCSDSSSEDNDCEDSEEN